MKKLRFRPVLLLFALFSLATRSTLFAGTPTDAHPGLSGVERRERSLSAVQSLADSPTHQAFERLERAGTVDDETLQRYLEWLPIPPAELFAIFQERNFDMTPVPQSVDRRQTSWVKLHEIEARELYGDRYVDARLGLLAPKPGVATRSFQFGEGNVAVGTYQQFQPDDYQGEVVIAVNPNNSNQVVTAANTYDNIPGLCNTENTLAIGASQDGGVSWTYTCAPQSAAWTLGTCPAGASILGGDPAVAWNGLNQVFINYLVICRVSSNDIRTGVVTIRSLDGGGTWAKHGLISNGWSGPAANDKNMFAIDANPASPYYNRQYSCWHRGPFALTAYSANGTSWSVQQLPTMINSTQVYACDLSVTKDGTVHLALNSDDSNNPARISYFHSTNGGQTWTGEKWLTSLKLTPFQKPEAQDDRGIFPFAAIDADTSSGPCAGNLYIAFSDFSNGETVNSTDVWLIRSTDGGATWSSRVKINDDALFGRVQFHPALRVDPTSGDLFVAWYDARNSSTNRAVDIYAARSTDCGLSFETNQRVTNSSADFRNFIPRTSDENSLDNPLHNANQYGEYMGIDAVNGRAYIAWTDTREFYPSYTTRPERENVAFSRVDFSATCGNDDREGLEVCDGTDLAGKTCTSLGYPTGTLACYNDCRAFATGGCGFSNQRFYSYEIYDGSVEASGSGTVFVFDSGDGFGVRIGDTGTNGRRKGIFSFDTSSIPDNAVIKSATLRIHRAAVVGKDPFNLGLGTVTVAMSHAFNGNIALETADFGAPALPWSACSLSHPTSDHGLALCKLGTNALGQVNKTGHTQFRLSFSTGSNGDNIHDYMSFFDGAALGALDRPELIVEW